MPTCPHCHQTLGQQTVGLTPSGSQRYPCRACQRKYTPQPNRSPKRQAIPLLFAKRPFNCMWMG